MRTSTRSLTALLAVVAISAAAAGCTVSEDKDKATAGAGSIKKIDALAGKSIRVGSKEFDEQLLLGQIAIVALEATGAKPVDKTNITGSDNVRKSLTGNAIDLYWEYTGTGWVSYLKQTKQIADPVGLYDAVKKADEPNGITWWARSPANDTYAIVASSSAAQKTGVKTISDYAALAKKNPAQAATCMGPEFKARDDGFPGVEKTYGFKLPTAQTHLLNDSIVYPTVGKGATCSFGSVASTDGRVAAQKLVILEDDKHFFPVYNPAITIRASVAKQYPQLEQVFSSIATKLDSKTLTTLNEKVSVGGEDAKKVAKDWLKANGYVS
ncbi:glycine betaine ABC transporter substrate-binding protein [Luteipulveratus mongoliensis]|uniref:Glycine/betaine ABC transporter substrate-binding protein n=1 Tax=Luteipulveratus mongoliensis TaxID=571913 RepID=A0A0K1JE09_9MICO|nr:glycine betaine ABC transporter substrate-binding protein [Luteipulveratus mongoliensis]AKU14941.1 glycine/betaine ABC transporter substrate-binding protein [Luteipulveratus mongoliensis]